MPVNAEIKDGKGTKNKAKVTTLGQLVVAPLDFSDAYAVEATVINTAYNFVGPSQDQNFIVTDILISSDRNVGVNGASVQLYEADSATSTTVSKSILNLEMLKQTSRDMTGLNLRITKGKWLNLKTDDNTIYTTVTGYYA